MSDRWLWSSAVLIAVAAGVANYYFASYSLLLRMIALFIAAVLIIAMIYRTSLGLRLWSQWLEVVQEIQKMYWPTRQETLQTTFAVLAMVMVMGVLLWTADFILLRLIKWLTGNWGA